MCLVLLLLREDRVLPEDVVRTVILARPTVVGAVPLRHFVGLVDTGVGGIALRSSVGGLGGRVKDGRGFVIDGAVGVCVQVKKRIVTDHLICFLHSEAFALDPFVVDRLSVEREHRVVH